MLLPAVRRRHSNESRQEAEERNRRRQPAQQSPSALRGAGQRWRQRGQGDCGCSNLPTRFRNQYRRKDVLAIVADPGCLSRIRIFSIPDPHQRIQVF